MRYYMNLYSEPFSKIKSGKKTIELRLNDEKRQLIRTDDEIEFKNIDSNETILTKVLCLHHFKNFEELYKVLPLLKCGYDETDICNAKASDMNVYYSTEKQNFYGVLGIELKLLSKNSDKIINRQE